MKTLRSGSLGLAMLLLAPALHAQVPQLLNYQGRVAVGTTNFDGPGSFRFALVNTDGATSYWSNDGTSAAGSQPTAAVALTVTKGLYSVQLGDTALPNMTAIPATVFANPDVRLRVWFDDGVNDSQLLTPDQRIAAVGYAMMADMAQTVPDGSITGAKIAGGSITATQLAPGLANAPVSVTGSAQDAVANTAYAAIGDSPTIFTLPATAELGDVVRITGTGAGGWLTRNASWTPHEADRNWVSVTSSADGTKLAAVVKGGKIHTSADGGATWTERDSDRNWASVASSADGTRLIAAEGKAPNGAVYRSTKDFISRTKCRVIVSRSSLSAIFNLCTKSFRDSALGASP